MSDECSDQILDYLTAEMLHGPKPPDLSARIEAAWAAELDSSRSAKEASRATSGVDTAVSGTALPLPAVESALASKPPVAPPVQVRSNEIEADRQRASWVPALTASAAVLIAAIAWAVWPNEMSQIADAENTGKKGAVERDGSTTQPIPRNDDLKAPRKNSLAGSVNPKRAPSKEQLDLDNLPFNPLPVPEDLDRPVLAENAPVVDPIAAAEIVREVDQQLADMWESLGVQPSARLADSELATSMLRRLAGVGSLEEFSGSTSFTSGMDQAAFAKALMETPEAAAVLARQLSKVLITDNQKSFDSSEAIAFLDLAAETINSGESWNGFIGAVLGADLTSEGTAPVDTAAQFFYRSLAGGSNHRLMNRIGSNFLNVNTSCARCHDRQSPAPGLFNDQKSYWSMLALLNGVQSKWEPDQGERVLLDRQEELFADGNPLVYYPVTDGQVFSAAPELPNGRGWDENGASSPRESLADWISESTLMDQAVVNQTWKILFGRNLVPQVRGIDVVAIPEREAIMKLLSEQYRAHGRDIRALVGWMASTEVFALAPVRVSRQQWLEESDEAFERLQLAELAFAVPASLGTDTDGVSLARSLETMKRWSAIEAGHSLDNLPAPTLAQPSSDDKVKAREVVLDMPSVSFVVHRDRPTEAEKDFVDKLLAATELSWSEKVLHVVSLFPEVNSRPQDLGNKLLEYHNGNSREALITLLWAVKNNAAHH